MNIIKRNIFKIITLILIILCILAISLKYYLYKNEKENIEEEKIEINKKEEKEDENENKKTIGVDIKGAIKNPGVYETEENSRVIDIIKLSGGLTSEADTTYINLSKKVKDEMVIIIYTKDQIKQAKQKETLAPTNINNSCICPKITNDSCITKENANTTSKNKTNTDSTSSTDETKEISNDIININTATKEELQTLKGIGEGKADAIIKYREENGKFVKPEDIMNVNGIGESVYEKIKDNITV